MKWQKFLQKKGAFIQGVMSVYRRQHKMVPELRGRDPLKPDQSDLPLEGDSP